MIRRKVLQMLGMAPVAGAIAATAPRDYYDTPPPTPQGYGVFTEKLNEAAQGFIPKSQEDYLLERLIKYKTFGLPKWYVNRHTPVFSSDAPFEAMKSWSPTYRRIAMRAQYDRDSKKNFVQGIKDNLKEVAWRKVHGDYP